QTIKKERIEKDHASALRVRDLHDQHGVVGLVEDAVISNPKGRTAGALARAFAPGGRGLSRRASRRLSTPAEIVGCARPSCSGLLHRKPANLAKSPSVELSVRPYSMA